ncbi:MAG: hypothetical protein ACRD5M_10690 [Candidatus Acidiferrales bacterium]
MTLRWLAIGVLVLLGGCSGWSPNTSTSTDSGKGNDNSSAAKMAAPAPHPIVIPAGTVLDVTLDQSVSSKTNNSGDNFDASLAAPVTLGDRVVLPVGTKAIGSVTLAQSAGRFHGHATLAMDLVSLTFEGARYKVQSTGVERESKGRGKRTGIGAGGGAVFGAIVGGLAGGGAGAAIGAAAGGGAGAAGAGFTGKRDITLPAETRLSFKLTQPLTITPK